MTRIRPEARRANSTFTIEYRQQRYAVSVGFLPDRATPIEVFVTAEKTASDLEALARDTALVLSFAMQYGAPLAELCAAVSREQSGAPSSLIGVVLDAVTERFGG